MGGVLSGQNVQATGDANRIVSVRHCFPERTDGPVVGRDTTLRHINTLSQSEVFVCYLQNIMNSEAWNKRMMTTESGEYFTNNRDIYFSIYKDIEKTLASAEKDGWLSVNDHVIARLITTGLIGALSTNAQQALADLASYMDEAVFRGRPYFILGKE